MYNVWPIECFSLVWYCTVHNIYICPCTVSVGVQVEVAVGEAEGSLERGAQNGGCHAQ